MARWIPGDLRALFLSVSVFAFRNTEAPRAGRGFCQCDIVVPVLKMGFRALPAVCSDDDGNLWGAQRSRVFSPVVVLRLYDFYLFGRDWVGFRSAVRRIATN